VWPLAQYTTVVDAGVQDEHRSIFPAHLMVTQDYVFPASCSVPSGSNEIPIRSSGDASNSVWFAPEGTTSFTEGPTMTRAAGDATSIAAPSAAGTYKLFVVSAGGVPSDESSALLRVESRSPRGSRSPLERQHDGGDGPAAFRAFQP
jgi:hypothetical protein